jgi:hypothetical protein
MKQLEHSNEDVRQAAISCLSSLGAQGMYSLVCLEFFVLLSPPPSTAHMVRIGLNTAGLMCYCWDVAHIAT